MQGEHNTRHTKITMENTLTSATPTHPITGQYISDWLVLGVVENMTYPSGRVELQPGESRTLSFELAPQALAFWDPATGGWRAEAGAFELCAGRSARDLRSRARFVLSD